MAWTTPRTWTVGEIVTASLLNTHVRDNLTAAYQTITNVNTAVTVVNTVTETNLLNYTLAAGQIGTDKTIRGFLKGDYLNNSGSARACPVFKLKIGGTTVIANASAGSIGASATRAGWELEFEITALASASSQFSKLSSSGADVISGTAFTTGEGSNYRGPWWLLGTSAGATAIDMSGAVAIVVSVTLPVAHASLEVKMFSAPLEVGGG